MKIRNFLCICVNCDSIIYDNNPSEYSYGFTDAEMPKIVSKIASKIEKVKSFDNSVTREVCEGCKKQEYLIDVTSTNQLEEYLKSKQDNESSANCCSDSAIGIPLNNESSVMDSNDEPKKKQRTGSKTDYYNVFDGCTDVDSFCMKHNLSGFEFNVLKAFVGIVNTNNGKGARHGDSSLLIDVNKLVYYAGKMREKILIERGQNNG